MYAWLRHYESTFFTLEQTRQRVGNEIRFHGGIGTVMTAALAGKPVVGIGMMPEQEYNLECLVRKGFAKRIRRTRVTPKTVNEAIRTLLNDDSANQKATAYSRSVETWLNQRDQKIRTFFLGLSSTGGPGPSE